VVFRPYVGEVLVGRLLSCSKEGLRVGLDFFDDVLVPEHALQDPSEFNEGEKLWVWKFDGRWCVAWGTVSSAALVAAPLMRSK